MNKEQTTIEIDALEWWGKVKGSILQQMPDCNTEQEQIVKMYLAEHPTAPTVEKNETPQNLLRYSEGMDNLEWESNTVKEDSSSEEYFNSHKMTFTGVSAGDYLDKGDFLRYANKKAQENKKILEDNKLLREAFQNIVADWEQEVRAYKELSNEELEMPPYIIKARSALEQTK